MTAEEVTVRQVVQEMMQHEPRPSRMVIEQAVHKRAGLLGRADWWRVQELLDKVLGER
jgi:hypothetical protein